MSDPHQHEDRQEDELALNELCLPTLSTQVGRATQWNALISAYRRAAGVPGSTFEAPEFTGLRTPASSELPSRRSSGNDISIDCDLDSVASEASTSQQQRRPSHSSSIFSADSAHESSGYQFVTVLGKAGTGKSFLVQRLRKCIMDSFQQQHNVRENDHHTFDNSTISTKSGGFLRMKKH